MIHQLLKISDLNLLRRDSAHWDLQEELYRMREPLGKRSAQNL